MIATSYPSSRSQLELRINEPHVWTNAYSIARADGASEDEAAGLADETITDRRASKREKAA
jgi:hypothetical protein